MLRQCTTCVARAEVLYGVWLPANLAITCMQSDSGTHLYPDRLVVCKAGAIELLLQCVHPLSHTDLQHSSMGR
jgi:hypothetical protein